MNYGDFFDFDTTADFFDFETTVDFLFAVGLLALEAVGFFLTAAFLTAAFLALAFTAGFDFFLAFTGMTYCFKGWIENSI